MYSYTNKFPLDYYEQLEKQEIEIYNKINFKEENILKLDIHIIPDLYY